METRQHIAIELQEAGLTLPAGLSGAPFAVPEGYFAAFAGTVLRRIRQQEAQAELEELSPLLASLPKAMPFALPEGYFAAPPVPSLLDSLDRRMPFAVPEGYFEALPGAVLNRLRGEAVKEETPVVRMRPRWMRMAAAAVVGAALVVGGWLYESRPAAPASPEAMVQHSLQSVPDQALEDFIQTTDPATASGLAQRSPNRTDVRSMLHDVSVSEMDAFLEQVPGEDDPLADIN